MESIRSLKWLAIGAISTQDRCIGLLSHQGSYLAVEAAHFLEIVDQPSIFDGDAALKRQAIRNLWEGRITTTNRSISTFGLFDPLNPLKRLVQRLSKEAFGKNVVFDISCIPERFLFPMIRWLVEAPEVENLVLTYMLPNRYTSEDIAYDPQEWAQLPTFVSDTSGGDPPVEKVVVGVGFLPLSLTDWLKKTYNDPRIEVSLIFPFPASPSSVKKGWEFVRRIESEMTIRDERQVSRVGMHDLSGCFDRLLSITRNGKSPTAFAPYGPKTHSVAMCLQAMNMGAEVFFTHPSFYHPEYSTGLRMEGGRPDGYAYALKIKGTSLYSV